ncbi:MAG TPA: NAD(P)-binding domain-containing protein [Kofleriaceae bacterium]|nr:NAD(P)-binding domain-containing protein [Kofleriaceae bacterium]
MTHVAIIGGGPAGLATAACLAEHRVPFTVLERGDGAVRDGADDGAFAALRTLDPETQLLTPRRLSRLPGMPIEGEEYARFGDLVTRLDAWRVARSLHVRRADVQRVEQVRDGFVVHLDDGSVEATHVVNATGVIGQPVLPTDFDPARYPRRWLHSRDVRTPDLAAAQRLVVVGAGTSAAEVIERWLDVRSPDSRAWLSTRRRVLAAPQHVLGIDIHYWLYVPELVPGRVLGRRLGPVRDLIIGRRLLHALRNRAVVRVPAVARYDVTFRDGTRVEPDLLVLATGYRYGAAHLGALVDVDAQGHPIVDRHAASTRTRNLYVLGGRFGRSIASSTLRGIARDAAHVADRIARPA